MDFDLDRYERELESLVNIDSGSRCLEGVERVTDWFAERLARLGFATESVWPKPDTFGKSVYAQHGDGESLDLFIICHTDTVFPQGTVAKRPFNRVGDRYTGPGVADMKAGALMALHTLEQLTSSGRLNGTLGILYNGEHELSCPTVRGFIEEKSKAAKVVITTEPARADGSCVRQRKGILRFGLKFHGRSSHSGVAPEAGRCAVTEMAKMILDMKALEDPEAGITVNPGLVSGGVSVNAIPDLAECSVDLRVVRLEDAERLDAFVRDRAARPSDPDIRIELEGGITRPPLCPNERSEALITSINKIGKSHGLEMTWTFSGGGSDASYASAFGVPALCGLGPVGGNYHSPDEYLETGDLLARMRTFRDTVEAICNRVI